MRKKEELLNSQKTMKFVTQTVNEKATEVSYLVSYRIRQIQTFTTLNQFISEAEPLNDSLYVEFFEYLQDKRSSSETYFPEEQNTNFKSNLWVQNPFMKDIQKPNHMPNEMYESLLELSSDSSLKAVFTTQSLDR